MNLKPCPFCGQPAEFDGNRGYRTLSEGKLDGAVSVYCTSCPADMTLCRMDYPGETVEHLANVIAEYWNKRKGT